MRTNKAEHDNLPSTLSSTHTTLMAQALTSGGAAGGPSPASPLKVLMASCCTIETTINIPYLLLSILSVPLSHYQPVLTL